MKKWLIILSMLFLLALAVGEEDTSGPIDGAEVTDWSSFSDWERLEWSTVPDSSIPDIPADKLDYGQLSPSQRQNMNREQILANLENIDDLNNDVNYIEAVEAIRERYGIGSVTFWSGRIRNDVFMTDSGQSVNLRGKTISALAVSPTGRIGVAAYSGLEVSSIQPTDNFEIFSETRLVTEDGGDVRVRDIVVRNGQLIIDPEKPEPAIIEQRRIRGPNPITLHLDGAEHSGDYISYGTNTFSIGGDVKVELLQQEGHLVDSSDEVESYLLAMTSLDGTYSRITIDISKEPAEVIREGNTVVRSGDLGVITRDDEQYLRMYEHESYRRGLDFADQELDLPAPSGDVREDVILQPDSFETEDRRVTVADSDSSPDDEVARIISETAVSSSGLAHIANEEGFVGHVYNDPTGNPTIGFGHLLEAQEAERFAAGITRAEALELLVADVNKAERILTTTVRPEIVEGLTTEQYDTLVSFIYNTGGGNFRSSTLLRRLNEGNLQDVPNQIRRWVYSTDRTTGEKVRLPGLVARREREAQMFARGFA